MITSKQVFIASDGRQYDTYKEAEEHVLDAAQIAVDQHIIKAGCTGLLHRDRLAIVLELVGDMEKAQIFFNELRVILEKVSAEYDPNEEED